MTSRLRKKHPTTAPTFPREIQADLHRSIGRGDKVTRAVVGSPGRDRSHARWAALLCGAVTLLGGNDLSGLASVTAQAQSPWQHGNRFAGNESSMSGAERGAERGAEQGAATRYPIASSQSVSPMGWPQAGQTLVPVPRSGQPSHPTAKANPRRQGWNLKWRTSRNIASPKRTSPAAQARSIALASSRMDAPESSESNLRHLPQSISAATYLAKQQQDSGGETRVESGRHDYFQDPFGDGLTPTTVIRTVAGQAEDQVTGQATGQRLVQTRVGDPAALPLPAPRAARQINPPGRLGVESFADDSARVDLAGQVQQLPQPRPLEPGLSFSPSTQPPATQPPATLRPELQGPDSFEQPDAGPSIGELLKQSPPDAPEPNLAEADLPEPNLPESNFPEPNFREQMEPVPSSGSDQEFDDPFNRRNNTELDLGAQSSPGFLDQLDRDQLNFGELGNNESRLDAFRNITKTAQVSCESFRERIKSQTIDKVLLDISPPFRPDEIDQARYDRLKSRFDEKQIPRQWRNIEGVPLTNGRLVDLAFEKAVIETEFGVTQRLPIKDLSEADLAYISENWGLPMECRLEQVASASRNWTPMTMTWKASNICYNPLYFEDVNLERYGHTHGPVLEPLVQTAHFFGNIAILPYKMGVHAPTECRYPLGYYRPGNCAPWIKPPIPISLKGAYAQAAAVTGLFWAIP